MELWKLAAIEGVRKTMAEYVVFTDSGRVAEFAALFGEKGEFVLPDGSSHIGATAIAALLNGHAAYFAANPEKGPPGYLRHQITTADIEIHDEDSAHVDSYFMTLTQNRVDHWGKWIDDFKRDAEGRWRFHKRVVITDGYDPDGWFANSFSKL